MRGGLKKVQFVTPSPNAEVPLKTSPVVIRNVDPHAGKATIFLDPMEVNGNTIDEARRQK